ncbi:2OG-Fe(II) oxygenase family protein [Minwuia sp.]|uniref:2OG-Fe(II) oxygenase family protein n=1 Tax=Minwuia sp. TaxID=2493630 RepID=UPI003A8FB875
MADPSVEPVPTVDLGPLFEGDRIDTVVEAIDDALTRAGGFVVSGFPDAQGLDERGRRMLEFFDLPPSVRMACATRATNPDNANIYRGYVSLLDGGSFARNEMFDIGPATPVSGPRMPGIEILRERNAWPAEMPHAGWRAAMLGWYVQMRHVGLAVMFAVAKATGVDAATLGPLFQDGNSTLRLLNYPEDVADGEALAAGRHTDGAGLSLLWQGEPGLQVEGPDGVWRDVPSVSDSVSVHLGDVLEAVTDGAIPATPHRVLASGTPRRSIGFFLEPALGAPLKPARADAEDPSNTYAAHLLRRLRTYDGIGDFIPDP